MDMLPVKPERKLQLEEYAQRHGQKPADALDDVLADYFAWEQQDFETSLEAVRRGYDDMKAGRTKPASDVHEALRRRYGLSG